MAIEKSFLATQGWIVDKAYYKVHDVIPLTNELYQANVWIYTNEYERQKHPNIPLAQNMMKFDVDPSTFDAEISDNENQIKQAYSKLKVLTDSFKNDGTDV